MGWRCGACMLSEHCKMGAGRAKGGEAKGSEAGWV